MTEGETTPKEPRPSDEFDALLRSVARPDSVAPGLLRQLEAAAPAAAGTLQTPASPLPAEARAGEVLDGRYRLDHELGRGGMGVVFAAEDLSNHRRVALKWMSAQHVSKGPQAAAMVQRFRREARAAARIRHPNVVEVHDVGGTDSAPYIVMELLEGESLRQALTTGALGWSQALAIMLPVLRGVAAAHAAGIVHRDLKPDNIFLCGGLGAERVPKLLDFGVASVHEGSGGDLSTLTRTGSVLGTPSYMPLEQLKGESVDARADVYALGVVLYEMLSKQLPFSARGASELAVKQATELPTPLARHVPALRGEREAAVMRALARRAGDRYPDLATFEAALSRAGAPRRRSALVWIAGVLAVAVIAAALAWRGYSADSEPARVPKTSQPFERVSRPIDAPTELVTPRPPEAPPEPPIPLAPREQRARKRATPALEPSKVAPKPPTDLSIDDF